MPRIFSERWEKKSTWKRWKKSTSCFQDHSSCKCSPGSQGWRSLAKLWLDKSWSYNRRVSFTCFPDFFFSLLGVIRLTWMFSLYKILDQSDVFLIIQEGHFHVNICTCFKKYFYCSIFWWMPWKKIAWEWQLSHLHLSVRAVSLLYVIDVQCNLY